MSISANENHPAKPKKKEKENKKGVREKKEKTKKFTPALITPGKTICLEKQRGKKKTESKQSVR